MELNSDDRKELIKEMIYGEHKHDQERIVEDVYNMQAEIKSLKAMVVEARYLMQANSMIYSNEQAMAFYEKTKDIKVDA